MYNLHTHSHFSLLDGFCSPRDIGLRIKELGQDSFSITDHGTLSGQVEAYKTSMDLGLKYIFGVEQYAVPDVTVKTRSANHIIFYAKNQEGYYNLMRMNNEAHKNFYYTPRLDPSIISKYKDGLICTSACLGGIFNDELLWKEIWKIFGDDFYLELQSNTMKEQVERNDLITKDSWKYNIKLVMAHDAHYLRKEDAQHHRDMCNIKGESVYVTDDFYIHPIEKYIENYSNAEIVEKCEQVHLPKGQYFPQYKTKNALQEVREKMWAGWRVKQIPTTEQYITQAKHELSVLEKADYLNYLLMVGDICEYSRESGVAVGIGRGSGVGSLVCYSMGITGIDPIKYGLIFERFVHLERKSSADIDLDFSQLGRSSIINYITEKYGFVYPIRTFGYMSIKSALKRAGQALKIPIVEINTISAQLDTKPIEKTTASKRLVELTNSFIDKIQNFGKHASGIIVFPEDLTHLVPIERQGDDYVVAWDYEDLEKMGFLKLDVLGLKTLDVIQNTADIDWEVIPTADTLTFDMLCKGDTFGVFQIESDGMTKLVKELQPKSVADLVPLVALYRPGPMDSGMLKTYINRKCGKESVEYLHPDLEDILKETYGIILYQEQIMSIASKLGGYSLGEADMLRRAIGKKKPEELARLTEELKGRMLENSISDDVATSIINSIITFGDYGFNKSHAAAYAYTAFQTAYLKAHHRANFVCQLLNSEIGNLEKTAEYVDKSGIQIFPVSLTKSNCLWSVEDGGVRIGFSAIKGINLESCVNVDDIDAFCKANKLHKGKIEALGKAMSNNPHMQRDVLGFSLLNILDEYDISLCEKRNDIIGGEVTRVKPHTTKFGKPMSFITIKDRTDTHSLVLFNGDEIEVGEVYLAQVSGSKILKISKAPRKT